MVTSVGRSDRLHQHWGGARRLAWGYQHERAEFRLPGDHAGGTAVSVALGYEGISSSLLGTSRFVQVKGDEKAKVDVLHVFFPIDAIADSGPQFVVSRALDRAYQQLHVVALASG